MTRPATHKDIRKHYEGLGCEVVIKRNGRVHFRDDRVHARANARPYRSDWECWFEVSDYIVVPDRDGEYVTDRKTHELNERIRNTKVA